MRPGEQRHSEFRSADWPRGRHWWQWGPALEMSQPCSEHPELISHQVLGAALHTCPMASLRLPNV